MTDSSLYDVIKSSSIHGHYAIDAAVFPTLGGRRFPSEQSSVVQTYISPATIQQIQYVDNLQGRMSQAKGHSKVTRQHVTFSVD